MSSSHPPSACASCHTAASFRGECTRMPEGCPTLTRPDITKDVTPYLDPDRAELMRVADAAPFTADRVKRNRVEELVYYAKQRGIERIGVAFCVSMTREAQALAGILKAEDVSAELACCRLGAVDYDEIGLVKAHPERFAAICNPAAQARFLDAQNVQLIVQLGLCIGHDLILQAETRVPVTTLVVKDRALDHNPIIALRQAAPAA